MEKITYKMYLEMLDKNPNMRKVTRWSRYVFYHQFWNDWIIWYLSKENGAWRTFWETKVDKDQIQEIVDSVKLWISKEKISKEFWVSVRTIYRYVKRYEKKNNIK